MHPEPSAAPTSPVPGLSALTVIARGGYSTVYSARQDSVGREVALKIDTRSLDDERDRRRFVREAEAAGRMSGHPNVVNIYDAGVTAENHPYLVMELCSGGSYAAKLKQQGPLPPAEVRDVGVRIADALQAAHEAGVLHRDVKPGNILINRYGVPGLADFGLAALPDASRELSVTIEALTPAYAPPEVYRLERPGPLGDVYSLAASLYAMLSGRPPRWPDTGTPSLATMVRLLDEPVPDIPGAPVGLTAVLRQAMAADPADRYPSAGAFRDALAGADLDPTTATPRGPAGYGATRPLPTPGTPTSGAPASGWAQGGGGTLPLPGPGAGAAGGPPAYGTVGAGGYGASAPGYGPAGSGQAPPGYGRPPGYGQDTAYGQAGGYGQGSGYGPGGQGPQGPGGSWNGPPASPPVPAPRRRGRRGLVLGAVGVLVLLLVAGGIGAAVWNGRADPTPTGTTGPIASGSATPSATPSIPDLGGFPFDTPSASAAGLCRTAAQAAGIAGITARCPATPECWDRIDDDAARRRSCTARHTWETFVIGTLAAGTDAAKPSDVRKDPGVQALCTDGILDVLLTQGGVANDGWKVEVLGSAQAGRREFRCLAGKGDGALDKPVFVGA